ncbi:nuclear transport factor 2 family protein [Cupriavidus sp. WKF15]|uniref:nuclear transport factor 2 family protein n=1 Tax=Cupriavidus sp. WKF15 TaxID=3032282 RepID=UPI0023E29ABF|nr:nuclear transport factor 2 family protein [Cupriavidus sp. WKF15]WER50351.1 nuclear transport factor 2 family protein [Cupriavidus sp. WKF15]
MNYPLSIERASLLTTSPLVEHIDQVEQARCDATVNGAHHVLADLLADDLLFIHSSGYVHGKADYLAFLAEKIRTLEIARPSPPAYKPAGTSVLVCGPIDQTLVRRTDGSRVEVRSYTTQVWTRSGDGWRLIHHHSTRRAD